MNRILLIIGIVIVIAGILSLSFSALNIITRRGTLDGSAQLYERMHRRAVIFGISGALLSLIGAACIAFHSKL